MAIKDNVLFKKALILFVFSIILLIPLFFIQNVIEERTELYTQSSNEIGNSWAKSQSIAGPVIAIPYTTSYIRDEVVKNSAGKEVTVKKRGYDHYVAFFTPEDYKVNANVKDSVRNRGIYKSIVYTADIELTGKFNITDFQKVEQVQIDSIQWDKARIALGITDPRAIINISEFSLNKDNISIEADTGYEFKDFPKFARGGSSKIKLAGESADIPFSIKMEIKGSNEFNVIPIGNKNDITVKSTWKDPSFQGTLPTKREITKDGFLANWNTTNLPQNLNKDFFTRTGNVAEYEYNTSEYGNHKSDANIVGVSFYQGVTHYRQVIRAVKYAYLFIALSLLVLFIFEVVGKHPIHFLQYAIIGASLAIFYLLLLAITEHIPFLIAYLISALAIVIPITLYTISFMKNKRYGIGICATLSGLYLVLLSILQLEDYALLTGTGLLLITLYALMYLTRHLRAEQNEGRADKN